MSNQNLIILFGGESRERFVSVATAQNISRALPHALCWYWAPDDSVYQVTQEELLTHTDVFKTEFKPASKSIFENILLAFDSKQAANSVFVLGVHGGRGEDGTLQSWLEERKIAFTGSDSKACKLCMDKLAAKKSLESMRVRVAASALISGQDLSTAEAEINQFLLEYSKLILKPNAEGSSVGLFLITAETQKDALKELKAYPERQYLLEVYIQGTELTVGVFDDKIGPRALVPTELRAQEAFADYDGKYLGLGTTEITPAEILEPVMHAAQQLAILAHEALGCKGYSRTDMMVDSDGPVFLETNALPGLTKASLVPQALAYEGISIREFLMKQVELARVRLANSL
ncbi:MAG: ATP-grasp domain-containing protein [Myxococcaceae bacterium]